MNLSPPSLDQLWSLLGLTMISFLIIGTVLLLIALILRIALRRSTPSVRYATSLTLLAILAILPLAIASSFSFTTVHYVQLEVAEPTPTAELTTALTPGTVEAPRRDAETADSTTLQPELVEPTSTPTTQFSAVEILFVVPEYLPWLWIVGTPLTFLLLASGLVGAERLRRSCQLLDDGPVHIACDELRKALGIGREVGIAICDRVATPLLVGVVRPLILLPPAALLGWPPEQLEMVLLHELAHVRRWDNAVNLAQRIVESVLFFHPAVWIVSNWVRRDREDCCDAVVVAHTAKPQAYAELLVALAANQPLAGLAASAMAGHPLASRIRRILKLEDEPMLVSRKGLMLGASAVMAVVLCVVLLARSEAEEPVSRESERVADERSSEVTTKDSNDTKEDLTTEDAESTEERLDITDENVNKENTESTEENSLFPTLEEQKAADFAYKLLGVELENLNSRELERVKTKGYSGGLRVAKIVGGRESGLSGGDLLVGLHVWPTESLEQVEEILKRFDIHELSPLKFYVLRQGSDQQAGNYGGEMAGEMLTEMIDIVVTGRIPVDLEAWAEKEGFKQARLRQAEEKPAASLGKEGRALTLREAEINHDLAVKNYEQSLQANQNAPGSITQFELRELKAAADLAQVEVERQRLPLTTLKRQIQKELVEKENARKKATGNERILLDAEIPQLQEIVSTMERRLSKWTAPDLYDGKTFEEWRNLWKTELKTEKRIECINALAAFGRAGKGPDAAEAILEVAGEYDFSMNGNYIETNAVGKLKESILEALTDYRNHLPERDWLPLLQNRIESDPAKYRVFAAQLLPRLLTSDPGVKPILSELQTSEDQVVRQAALAAIFVAQEIYTDEEKNELIQNVLENEPVTAIRVLDQRLLNHVSIKQAVEFLLSEDDDVQLAARRALRMFFDKEKGARLTNELLTKLSVSANQRDQLATIRALNALRYQAKAAEPVLTTIIGTTDNEELMLAAVHAREIVTLENGHSRMFISPETKTAIGVSKRWPSYLVDELKLKKALYDEAVQVTGEQGIMGGGGGGMGGGGTSGGAMF